MTTKELEAVKNMHKTDIHCHLDGCLRPATMLDIAIKDNISMDLPMNDGSRKDIKECSVEEVKGALEVDENTLSLVDYLEKFAFTTALMQTSENLERIAYELVEDFSKDNVIYSEIRFGPHLHLQNGLSLEEVVGSVCKGVKRGEKDFNVSSNVILCILRNFNVELGFDIVDLADRFRDKGVVGMDIAGDEFNFPVELYDEVLNKARNKNVNITIHAGESRGAESVYASIERGADRIGHGINSIEDEATLELAARENVTYEVSFKSNMGTKLMDDFSQYPLKKFLEKGIACTICTDNRLMSNTTISKEIELIDSYLGSSQEDDLLRLEVEDYMKMFEDGIKAAYISDSQKKLLLSHMRKRNKKILSKYVSDKKISNNKGM